MNIIIAHGTMGSPAINWFPWARQHFGARGYAVHVPAFPTPINQNPAAWLRVLQAECPPLDERTVIIGHSIGATFLLHALAAAVTPVAASIFVAPVMGPLDLPDYDALNAPFTEPLAMLDLAAIKKQAGRVAIMHGTDDPYVPSEQAEALHQHLGGQICLVINGGHLNAESGFSQLDLLDQFVP